MSRVTVKYKPNTHNNGTIIYNLAHNGEMCDIDSGLKLRTGEWDNIISRVVLAKADKEREKYLRNVGFQIEADLKAISLLMRDMELKDYDYPVSKVAETFKGGTSEATLKQTLNRFISFSNLKGKNAEKYVTAVNALLKSIKTDDISLRDITSTLIKKFIANLMAMQRSRYTISTYISLLSAIYSKAVEWGITPDTKPFGNEPSKLTNFYNKDNKNTFREYLPKLQALDLSTSKELTFVRDLLLIAHKTHLGIRQLGTLTTSDTPGQYRSLGPDGNTEEPVTATPELNAFIEKYSSPSPSGYLVPLIIRRDTKIQGRQALINYEAQVRKHLRPHLSTLTTLLTYPGSLTLSSALTPKA